MTTNTQSSEARSGTTLRFGAGRAASHYGLPVPAALHWQRHPDGKQFVVHIDLDDLHDGELVVPSLILLSASNYEFRCSLTVADDCWWLSPVVSNPTATSTLAAEPASTSKSSSGLITTHIDFFAVHGTAATPQLTISVRADAIPHDYLLVISKRQRNINEGIEPPAAPRPEHAVPPLSQMVQPASQRQRTCSPTAVSMLLAYHGQPFHPALINHCHDRNSGLYGVWPLNMVQAARRDFTAAIELVKSWSDLESYTAPFIASISFKEGELDGAPLKQTAGHLVVVCGTTDTHVLCNDPAAASADDVARRYDLQQFSAAWLGSRGAAYLIQPTRTAATNTMSQIT